MTRRMSGWIAFACFALMGLGMVIGWLAGAAW